MNSGATHMRAHITFVSPRCIVGYSFLSFLHAYTVLCSSLSHIVSGRNVEAFECLDDYLNMNLKYLANKSQKLANY